IINIVTSKSIADGYNGSVQTSHRFPVGGPGIGANLNLKDKKFGMYLSGNASSGYNPETIRAKSLFGLATNNNLTQLGREKGNSENGYINTELSYELDSLTLMSGALNFNKNGNRSSSSQFSELRGTTLLEGYQLANNIRNSGNGNDVSFNFQRGFKNNKNELLTASYRTYGSESALNSSQLITSRVNYIAPDFNQHNLSSSRERTAQLDYYLPRKKFTFETGVKAISRANSGDFEYDIYDAISGQYALDPARSNRYTNDQRIYGAYTSFSLKMKGWSARAGLRLEQTQIDACIALCHHLMQQYRIPPINILAHSDIAPYRKTDPGLQFPWHQLAAASIVPKLVEHDVASIQHHSILPHDYSPLIDFIQALTIIGYDTRPLATQPELLPLLIANFQRRFCQQNITGVLDAWTIKCVDWVK
ncbi:MAG: hypothetical protein EOO68_32075, partial [Moraxellaceae bacterium]